jgi:hypothetical protein
MSMNRTKIIAALSTRAARKIVVAALIGIGTAIGVSLSPELADAVTSVALAVAGAL